ncbi:Helix-turn-helix domain-containing protein [Halobellus clavatus]|jgi:DNA-binding transcriptional ArsR family regulator|uniref:Helix-turn-helix domain-containing protein n=2 Tax=Halobellus clavatus TaxID=660517 RepID=A0A1H3EHF0_9EURY|nr:Helix-turn-helix domain-containing protein [Halobellus clavatus]
MDAPPPLPRRPAVEHTPQPTTTVVLDPDASADALDALRSETARDIVSALGDSPATASDLAERVETSLQNACHHLQCLQAAGLVTDAGCWYSAKGTEMTVYGLTSRRLELRLGAEA